MASNLIPEADGAMNASPAALVTLVLVALLVPLGVDALFKARPSWRERMQAILQRRTAPTQEDFLIGFPLFIVFCGILMGWMLLFIGVVRQGILR
ncbi:MAG: hypothetical protein ABI743_03720 [bacterium]